MKKLITYTLLFLLLTRPVYATVAVVQSISAATFGAVDVLTTDLTTTSANLIIVDTCYYVGGGGGAFTSITDSKSNTYTTAIGELTSSGDTGVRARQSYKANATGGAAHNWTLTIDVNGVTTIAVREVSDALTAAVLDRTVSKSDNTGLSGTSDSTATTIQAQELLAGSACLCTSPGTANATSTGSFTDDVAETNTTGVSCGILAASQVVAATGSYAFTFDVDDSVTGMIGMLSTWKEDIGTPATRAPRRGMVLQ